MTDQLFFRGCISHRLPDGSVAFPTLVELTWREKRIEHWLRFGDKVAEQQIDRHRRIVGFAPDSVFAFVRWAGNEYGTVISRIDIVRAISVNEPYQTLPFVRPGGEILLRQTGWPKVEMVLKAIDGVEAIGIEPVNVAPEYWRHVHNRLSTNEPFRAYTRQQYRAWLLRREVTS